MILSRVTDEKFSAPMDFSKVVITGLVLAGVAFGVAHRPIQAPVPRIAAPVHVRLIDASTPVPVLPDPEATMSSTQLMQRWEPAIADAAKHFKIPAAWIRNVMRSESGGRTTLNGQPIVSDKGALGLMQVEPGTYTEMAAQYRLGNDPFNTHDNIYAGAAYLRWLHGKYGYPAMFAAYNAGPGQLEDHLFHGAPLPQETQSYVAGITKALGSGTEWLAQADKLTVTAPNGEKIALDRSKILSVRAALPGEYAPGVAAVINMGHMSQGVEESPQTIMAAIGPVRHHNA